MSDLKDEISPGLAAALADHLAAVRPRFPPGEFLAEASAELEPLTLCRPGSTTSPPPCTK